MAEAEGGGSAPVDGAGGGQDRPARRLELLLDLSEALAGALDPDEVVETLGRLLVPAHADHLLVDLVTGPGRARRRMVGSGDDAPLLAELEATAAPWPGPGTPAARVLAGEATVLVGRVTPGMVARTTGGPERRVLAERLRPGAGIAVPVVGRERVLGALSLIGTVATGRRFDEDDVTFAVEVGRRAGLVLEVAQLLQAARDAARRTEGLQRLTAELATADGVDEVARIAAGSAAEAVGGNTSSVCLVSEDGGVDLVAERGYRPETVARWRRFTLDDPLPGSEAIRTGRPVLLTSLADRDERYPILAGTAAADEAFAVLPLLAEEGGSGILTVGFREARTFEPDEEALLVAIAGQCAQALQRARLREVERQASEHRAFLGDASGILNASLDRSTTLERLADLLVPRLADSASVHLDDGDGMRAAVLRHVDPEAESAMRSLVDRRAHEHLEPIIRGVQATAAPVLVERLDEEVLAGLAVDDEDLRLLRRLDLGSALVVALTSTGRTLGVLSLGRGRERTPFAPGDRRLVEDLCGLAARALDNARAHEARIALADALQASLLPPALPQPEGLELAVRYRSVGGGDIGGDFYDAFSVDGGGSWTVVIGDVCGKGPAAAAVTSLVRHSLRATARALQPEDAGPAALLSACNGLMVDSELGERFATIVVAELRVEATGGVRARLAVGGHPPPLVRRVDGSLEELAAGGLPVGLFADAPYDQVDVLLAPGDELVLFTDGLLEARSPSGAFAPQLLDQVLRATAGASCEETATALVGAIDAFEAGRPRDDLAVLLVRAARPGLPLVTVQVRATPTAAFIAADEHLDELLRELELIRLGRRQGVLGTSYPHRLLAVLEDLLVRQAELRAWVRDLAEAAAARGEPAFDTRIALPAVGAVVVEQLDEVLAEISRQARDGELLTLPPPAEADAALRGWLRSLARGLRTPDDDGGPPGDDGTDGPSAVGTAPTDLDDPATARHLLRHGDAMGREARRFLLDVLTAWGDADLLDRLELPLAELVTNAQIHARGDAEVLVLRDDRVVRVEVVDGADLLPAWRRHHREAGTGRGLRLVQAYADRWGAEAVVGGKRVWIEVDRRRS